MNFDGYSLSNMQRTVTMRSENAPFRYDEEATPLDVQAGTPGWYVKIHHRYRTAHGYWAGDHVDKLRVGVVSEPGGYRRIAKIGWLTRDRITTFYEGIINFLLAHIGDLVTKLDEVSRAANDLRRRHDEEADRNRRLIDNLRKKNEEIDALRWTIRQLAKASDEEDPITFGDLELM